ncbi:MAG: bifunctional demethylmenaquinone methyltransferase/2-methoxy-6-polyprenyl-1,4-benzoquinol methylase [Legionellales bacterium RIFCSPHIGHO2_12_FULL_35_11]|nr:MAG: bifunctional demethylmenaquinone methyltransferase/2-methoxy-6-polyprenyl-1,4-benzoquinol methylase [Legionellales bacterium RIFCSPHIGHO2_12_FULL_35_11]
MNKQKKNTDFGFQSVPSNEKEKLVGNVFHSVAQKYDVMNDVMSLGIHRLWKFFTIELSQIKSGDSVLDLAGGSGDLTKLICKKIGKNGHVVLADINSSMLSVGRNRLIDKGFYNNITFIQTNAEHLPFANNLFNCITMAFGLRNVTNKENALKSMFKVLKPGGNLMILEFSKPVFPGLKPIYDWYSFNILPKIGGFIAKDEDSYKYLAESIRMHPPQEELKKMIEEAGFEDCNYQNISGGIVALHTAYKY